MRSNRGLIFGCFLTWPLIAEAQAPIAEMRRDSEILTPLVYPTGNPVGYPIIELLSGQTLDFHFDEAGNDRETYRYAAIHCDHQWIPSDIETTEYVDGFPWQEITDVEASFGTRFDYVHYSFRFPSEMMRPKISGNYAVVVFTGTDPSDRATWVNVWRVLIYESMIRIKALARQSSVVSRRFKDYEIDCELFNDQYRIFDPYNGLHLSIVPNGDWTHALTNLSPVFVKPESIVFDYNDGTNSIPGGNEWRQFEMKDLRFSGISVDQVAQVDGCWHLYLRPDQPSGNRSHEGRIDLNGKFLVRSDIASDSHLEAEYVWVHFALVMPEAPESDVCIEGGLSRGSSDRWKMVYSGENNAYQYSALVKQGYYNYRYVMYDQYHPKGDTSFIEGDHSSTENDYHVVVYNFDRGLGCDRVIGVHAVNPQR